MSTRKWILYLLLISCLLLVFYIALLYSTTLANIPFIINFRNTVLNKFDYVTPQSLFIYKVRAIKIEPDGSYIYKFPGKFKSMNFEEQTITLADLNGNEWTFKYFENKKVDGSVSKFKSIDYLYIVRGWGKKYSDSLYKITIDSENPSKTQQHFSYGDLLVLYWSDDRKLSNIIKDTKEGKVNILNGAKMIQINKVVWKK